ncbi:MAG: recombination-associated protein RdgC [Proteobacteria bacterium]|nr:recombination-associated protein RdgC [Pseudomonadota bacterium]HQR02720.1 recombination-associated protein RdgC [Rhodocyclaceae bacterium]
MWFRNLRLYRIAPDWAMTTSRLDEILAGQPLQRCGAMDMQSRGWVPPRPDSGFVHEVNGQWLLALGVEKKLLPASVVRQVTQERAAGIEAEQDRKVGRKELRDLRERVTEELLPRAFSSRRTTWGWIAPRQGWLVVDAGSDAKADEFLEALLHGVGPMPLTPLKTRLSPATAMTEWLASGEAPAGFTVDRDLELRSAAQAQAAIRYVHHALEGEEIRQHIGNGKLATRLGMTWADRISFVLTEKLQIKRLAFLDILKEEAEQAAEDAVMQFDVDFALMAGELVRMFDDLMECLGGEMVQE